MQFQSPIIKRHKVNTATWTNKKQELDEKYGGELRPIIAGIKRGLTQNRLAAIQIAAQNLYSAPEKAPATIAYLNNLSGCGALKFRWFPAHKGQSAKLLIRNGSIGLLVKTDPDSSAEAMIISEQKEMPFCTLEPEKALSALSLQVRSHFISAKIYKLKRALNIHLQVVSNVKS